MSEPLLYLDNNATTGLDPRVAEAMRPLLAPLPFNPSSLHAYGRAARAKLIAARRRIAAFLRVAERELLFTSGGTEALNMAIRSAPVGAHLISSDVEHAAVYQTLQQMQRMGRDVSLLPAGSWGAVTPDSVRSALRPQTKLIVLTAANAETGVKIDIGGIASIAEERGIPFLLDGVSFLGKEPLPLPPGVSAAAFSAHKLHGPHGVGCLLARAGFPLTALLTGGEQEFSLRAGTENLAGIVGFAAAIELLEGELEAIAARMRALRDRFEAGLRERFPSLLVNGEGPRIGTTSNLSFPGVDGESLLLLLDRAGVAASHGTACASGSLEPSRVLTQMGLSRERVRSSLRFSLSRWTTEEEIELAIARIAALLPKLQSGARQEK